MTLRLSLLTAVSVAAIAWTIPPSERFAFFVGVTVTSVVYVYADWRQRA